MAPFSSKSKEAEAEEEQPPDVVEGFTWSGQGDGLPAYTAEAEGGSNANHTLHVYRAAGVFSNDLIVTGAKKDKVLYYLRLPHSVSHAWKDTFLYEGYKGGPVVAEYSKKSFISRSHITIQYYGKRVDVSSSEPTTIELLSTETVGDDHAFTVPGTKKTLKWRLPLTKWDARLVDEETGEQVAVFELTPLSTKKCGRLQVDPRHLDLLELIILTGIAMNRHRAQKVVERRGFNGFGHGGGGGGP